ncbi:MAG: hypothetical protein ACOCRX_03525 [Candidatus Woesearchaeota archaeon]
MKYKILILFLLGVILSTGMFSYDIGDFPSYFMRDDTIAVTFILGSNAHAKDVVSAIDIATKMQFYQDSVRHRSLGNIAFLDNEISNLHDQNSIVVGGPCINSAAAELLDFPIDCRAGLSPGDSLIKLFEFGNTYSLLIAGYHADDTRRASSVLANHEDYNLSGRSIEVYEQSFEDFLLS